MPWNVTLGKVIGEPDNLGWTQVYEFKPQDELLEKTRGEIWAIISINPTPGIDRIISGRKVISRLHEEYFGKIGENAFLSLKHSLEVVNQEFSNFESLEIAAVCYIEDAVYLIASGGARVSLFRDGNLTPLLKSEKGKIILASGYPEDNDLFILTTQHLFEIVTPGIIKGAVEVRNLDETVEALAPIIHSQVDEGNLGILILSFAPQLQPKIGKIPSIAQTKLKPFLNKYLEKKVFVKGGQVDEISHKKKLSISVGVLLLFILSVSIFFGIRQKRQVDYQATYEQELSKAQHELEEAEALFALNQQRSRELFQAARDKVLGLSDQGIEDQNLDNLKRKINEREGLILGEYTSKLDTFVDLSLLTSGFKADEISTSNDNLYVLDKESKRIIKVALDTKRSEVFAGPSQIDEVESFTTYSDRVFFVNSLGLFELGEGKVIETDWQGKVLPFAYAANIYILERDLSRILRYAGTESRFGTQKDWLAGGVSVDLSEATQIVIDGSIWVLTGYGKILKFNLGNPQNFIPKGIFPEIQEPYAIYTDENLEHLYILEPGQKRIVVVTKEGDYKAQYIEDTISEAKALVVSESQRKIILMTSDKLFSMEIKHL